MDILDINSVHFRSKVQMEYVATCMLVLMMKLMSQMKLYGLFKHGAIIGLNKNTIVEVICIRTDGIIHFVNE